MPEDPPAAWSPTLLQPCCHAGEAVRIECLGGKLTKILAGSNGWNRYGESGGGGVIPPGTAGI